MRQLVEQKIKELAPAAFKSDNYALAGINKALLEWTARHETACSAWDMPTDTAEQVAARKAAFAKRCSAQCAELSDMLPALDDETLLAVMLRLADTVAFDNYH